MARLFFKPSFFKTSGAESVTDLNAKALSHFGVVRLSFCTRANARIFVTLNAALKGRSSTRNRTTLFENASALDALALMGLFGDAQSLGPVTGRNKFLTCNAR